MTMHISMILRAFALFAGCASSSAWFPKLYDAHHSMGSIYAKQDLGQKPAMGYNTWNFYFTEINETLVMQLADLMRDLGLVDAGYTYLNLDDAWSAMERDSSGRLVPHPLRFPSGIPRLVQYAKQRGLKLGIYTDAGTATCAGYPGSLGHEQVDSDTFAQWGISYVKVDNCNADAKTLLFRYATMGVAMTSAAIKYKQPMWYSLCSWGVGLPWYWARLVSGNSWRTSGDIEPHWDSILRCAESVAGLAKFAGPGGWNDPDMLEIGNGDLTVGMQRAHFALWCLMKAPLLIGTNLHRLASEDPAAQASLEILLNRELIAIHQDDLGAAGDRLWGGAADQLQLWAAALADGSRAVVVVNTQGTAAPASIAWQILGYTTDTQVTIRDMYSHQDIATGVAGAAYNITVPPFDCVALRLTPTPATQVTKAMLSWRPWTAACTQNRRVLPWW